MDFLLALAVLFLALGALGTLEVILAQSATFRKLSQ